MHTCPALWTHHTPGRVNDRYHDHHSDSTVLTQTNSSPGTGAEASTAHGAWDQHKQRSERCQAQRGFVHSTKTTGAGNLSLLMCTTKQSYQHPILATQDRKHLLLHHTFCHCTSRHASVWQPSFQPSTLRPSCIQCNQPLAHSVHCPISCWMEQPSPKTVYRTRLNVHRTTGEQEARGAMHFCQASEPRPAVRGCSRLFITSSGEPVSHSMHL